MNAVDLAALREVDDQARAFKRFGFQFTILVHPTREGDTPAMHAVATKVTAYVTNISLSGMCFNSSTAFSPETNLMVDISVAIHNFSIPVIVRRCAAVDRPGRSVYACGVQYIKSAETTRFIPILAKYLLVRGMSKV